jgi:membrane-associated phospholipid phosphatase
MHAYYTPLRFPSRWGLLLAGILLLAGCQRDEEIVPELSDALSHSAQVPLQWNSLLLDLERFTPGYRPPISARTAGYVGLAAYEALQPGMADRYNSLGDQFTGLDLPPAEVGAEYHWPTVASSVYAESLELFFPTAPAEHLFRIYELREEQFQDYRSQVPQQVFYRSLVRGREVAEAVFAWSQEDAAGDAAYLRNQDPSYVPPTGPGHWQPTYPDFTPALLPRWGEVRTFVAGEDDRCPDPLAFSEDPASAIAQQASEVYHLVDSLKRNHLPEYRWIAEFWSDDCPILTFTPAGRWIAVTNQVLEREAVSLGEAVETYARVGLALADGGIRCWNEKYRYNYQRPIDYIHEVKGVTDWNTIMCPDGSGNYFTPNFPAYPSGHATFGAAACEVLTDLYGANYRFTDRSHEGRTEFNGTPRTFNTFYEMAEENAFSRIPLGVHFRMDSDTGLELGYGIGRKVNALPWRR